MIQVNNLTKYFDKFCALDNANLHVQKGSIYGLVGANGAGKSTIIRHITGIYQSKDSEVLIDGEPIFENIKTKEKIGYIPDDIYFFPQASILDMMKFYKNIYPKFDIDRFNKLKGVFDSINPKRPIRQLSKGMQKQVGFWLLTCFHPEIIVLDEPVDGLDPVMRRQVWSLLMSDVAEYGITVLVSSHNLRELEDICDYVGIMNKGKVLLERSLSELQGNITKLQVVYEGEPRLPEGLEVLNRTISGRIHTLIVKGNPAMAQKLISTVSPVFADAVPLSLEEIFIYELGGEHYEVKEILLP